MDAKSKKAKQQELLRKALSKTNAKRMLQSNHPSKNTHLHFK
jgi:DNA repair protein RadC